MSEAKPIASLSSTLLARKGHAKPAMRPQGYTNFGFGASHAADDLGWNDMGGDPAPQPVPQPAKQSTPRIADVVPITAAAPAVVAPVVVAPIAAPVVHRQQEEIAREMAAPVTVEPQERRRDDRARDAVTVEIERTVAPRAARGSKSKAAFTLRLDGDRHLKLRLAGAVAHRSSQAIVVEALDAYLDTLPRVTELARGAGRSSAGQDTKTEDKR